MVTELTTSRLRLRRARSDDLAAMHAILSDPRAMRYWSTPPHRELAQTGAWLDAMITSPLTESDDFIVTFDDVAIGKLGAWRLPEIGYILDPRYWGRGFAAEAMAAFVPHVFARPELHRLTADVDPRNLASLALLDRHGFVRTGFAVGTWTTHIGVCDSLYLALERDAVPRLSSD